MAGLLTELLTTETIPYLPMLVTAAVALLLIYKGLYKEDPRIREAMTGIPALVIIMATVAMNYLDASILNVFGPVKGIVFIVMQVVGGAVLGAFIAVLAALGFGLIELVAKK